MPRRPPLIEMEFPISKALFDKIDHAVCGSACKKDPVSGVIGV